MQTKNIVHLTAVLALVVGPRLALAQVVRADYELPARGKVPAVSHASFSEPEAAPAPTQAPAKISKARRPRSHSAFQTVAHHAAMPGHGEVIMEGPGPDVQPYPMPGHNMPYPEAPYSDMHGDDLHCCDECSGDCGQCCCADCCPDPCCTIWENLQVFGGVEGFKSPADQGLNGNFGFHEGVNWAGPLFEYRGVGAQIGARVAQSNLHESFHFEDNRIQFFLTTGLFHRPFDQNGWQGGVVFDWLHDDFYVQMDVAQVRGELSWLSCGHHEIGGWMAIGTTSDTDEWHNEEEDEEEDQRVTWEPIHLYSLFYRRHFCSGASGRFSAGFTGEGEGLLGVDALAPLTHDCALVVATNYIIGRNDPEPEESLSEAWGLTISLVWFPGYKSPCSSRNAYRPLFDVADNTWMMLKFGGHEDD